MYLLFVARYSIVMAVQQDQLGCRLEQLTPKDQDQSPVLK